VTQPSSGESGHQRGWLTWQESPRVDLAGKPTIFGPLSLLGIALNGLGWDLLGLDVALRGRRS
jgi:hypothetical protein